MPIRPGKYKRAFEWRFSRADKDSIDAAAEAFVGLSASEYSEVFEDYLCVSRKRRKNRTAIAKNQLHLVDELVNAEKAIKHYKETKERLTTSLAQPGQIQPNSESLREDLKVIDKQIFLHRVFANTMRAIGDGIAWRALNYDRVAIRILSERATKQQILSEGTVHELDEWSRSFDTGTGVAIYNALTNCLAVGDITVVRNDGSIEVVEAKSTKTKSRRITRQKQKLREVFELLNFGEGEHEGENVEIFSFDIELENGLNHLSRLLNQASESGCVAERISNFCYLECVDFRRIRAIEECIRHFEETRERELAAWLLRKDLVIDMDSLEVLLFSPNKAPFSIYPFPESVCIDLLTGAKAYRSHFNFSALSREYERAGWQIEEGPAELMNEYADQTTPIFKLKKGACHYQVPPGDMMRLQMELLRPKVLLKTMEKIYELGPSETPRATLVAFDRESEIWS